MIFDIAEKTGTESTGTGLKQHTDRHKSRDGENGSVQMVQLRQARNMAKVLLILSDRLQIRDAGKSREVGRTDKRTMRDSGQSSVNKYEYAV